MEAFIQKLFRLREGELQKLIPLGLILLSNSLAVQNSYIASVSGFLSQVGINKFIVVSSISYFLLLVIMALQSLVIDRFDRLPLMRQTTLVFMGIFIALRAFFWLQFPNWLNYSLFYLITEIQWLVYPLVFWIFANNLFTLAEGKRIFPLLGGWGLAGKLLGIGISTLAPNLFKIFNIQPAELITVNIIFYGIALICLNAPIVKKASISNSKSLRGKRVRDVPKNLLAELTTEQTPETKAQFQVTVSEHFRRIRSFQRQDERTEDDPKDLTNKVRAKDKHIPDKRFRHITFQDIQETYRPGLTFIQNVPSFTYLTISLLSLSVCDAIVEFRFLEVSDQAFTNSDHYQIFYGLYRLILTVLGLIIQIFCSSQVIERMGLKNTFLILPIFTLLGLVWCLILPGLTSSLGAILLFRLSWDTIDESSRKSFQALIPEDLRGRVSLFIDGYLPALGNIIGFLGVGLVVILGIWSGFQLYFYGYLALGLIASLTGLIAIFKMRKIYDQSLLSWRLTRRKRAKSILDDFKI